MTDVLEQLVAATNRHDLEAVARLIHEEYRSEQPVHPGRAFVGRTQMLANWEAMFAGIPDFTAEIIRSVLTGDITWVEWRWSGTRTEGQPFHMRGVSLFEVRDGRIVAGTMYMDEVEHPGPGIAETVEHLSGRRVDQPTR